MTSLPVISIVISSYNHGAYIGQALESVLAQSYASFEAIVVDDGSSDDSWRIIQDFAALDERIKTVKHPDGGNHGLCATLSLALECCRGEYIAFLESDDFWKPDCLEKRLTALQKSNAGAVFNSVEILCMPGAKADGDSIMANMRHARFSKESGPVDIRTNILIENVIPAFSAVMLRRSLLKDLSFASPVPQWLDWWLWVQIAQTTLFAYIPERMTVWRSHAASYNSRYSFHTYMKMFSSMRKGLTSLIALNKYHLTPLQRILMHCPAPLLLALRMLAIWRYGGPHALYARVASKITARTWARVS